VSNKASSDAVKLIRRHATVASIKRQALAAASNWTPVSNLSEVKELFVHPLTRISKPRALFVVASRDVRMLKRCRLLHRKAGQDRLAY
jgi:hypothetical protein